MDEFYTVQFLGQTFNDIEGPSKKEWKDAPDLPPYELFQDAAKALERWLTRHPVQKKGRVARHQIKSMIVLKKDVKLSRVNINNDEWEDYNG